MKSERSRHTKWKEADRETREKGIQKEEERQTDMQNERGRQTDMQREIG